MAKAKGYVLGNIPEEQKFRGQASLVIEVLLDRKPEPTTVAEIVKRIEDRLQTRQDPTRVVSFYMSVWKKRGWVSAVDVDSTDEAAAADQTEEPFNDHDMGAGLDPEERVEAQLEAAINEAHSLTIEPGTKLSEAVRMVLTVETRSMSAADLADRLNTAGFETEEKRVRSAVQSLVQKGVATKLEDGTFRARS